MVRPSAEQLSAALHQLRLMHEAGQRSTAAVRLVADGLDVTERAVWLRLQIAEQFPTLDLRPGDARPQARGKIREYLPL